MLDTMQELTTWEAEQLVSDLDIKDFLLLFICH